MHTFRDQRNTMRANEEFVHWVAVIAHVSQEEYATIIRHPTVLLLCSSEFVFKVLQQSIDFCGICIHTFQYSFTHSLI